jgi:integrase/recombinase XerD
MALTTADTDAKLVDLWLAGRPATTQHEYRGDYALFSRIVSTPLRDIAVDDLVTFTEKLGGSEATRARRIAAIKSLLSFGAQVGYLPTNLGRFLRTPKVRQRLHERILDETEVRLVIGHAASPRDRALLRVLYLGGVRISEAVGLRWVDVAACWITVHGKGSKTRTVLLPEPLVEELIALRMPGAQDVDPIFVGRKGQPLSSRWGREIVTRTARRALTRRASPHFLRHAHATHAIQHGAGIHLVQQTLGHASLSTTALYLHVRPGEGSSQYLIAG